MSEHSIKLQKAQECCSAGNCYRCPEIMLKSFVQMLRPLMVDFVLECQVRLIGAFDFEP